MSKKGILILNHSPDFDKYFKKQWHANTNATESPHFIDTYQNFLEKEIINEYIRIFKEHIKRNEHTEYVEDLLNYVKNIEDLLKCDKNNLKRTITLSLKILNFSKTVKQNILNKYYLIILNIRDFEVMYDFFKKSKINLPILKLNSTLSDFQKSTIKTETKPVPSSTSSSTPPPPSQSIINSKILKNSKEFLTTFDTLLQNCNENKKRLCVVSCNSEFHNSIIKILSQNTLTSKNIHFFNKTIEFLKSIIYENFQSTEITNEAKRKTEINNVKKIIRKIMSPNHMNSYLNTQYSAIIFDCNSDGTLYETIKELHLTVPTLFINTKTWHQQQNVHN